MKKLMLTDELYDKIRAIAKECLTQNNYATARPLYFTIRDKRWVEAPPGNCDRVMWYSDDMAGFYYDDEAMIEDVVSDLTDAEKITYGDKIREWIKYGDYDEIEACSRRLCVPVTASYERAVYVKDNVFLTETACLRHIQENAHHFSGDVHAYCDHAYRNPEMETIHELMKAINEQDAVIPEPIDDDELEKIGENDE